MSGWNPGFGPGGGGGYLNDTTNADSPSQAQKKKGDLKRLQSVVPVTIGMIKKCKEEEFKLFGFPVQIVDIIGIVRKYVKESTKCIYQISDHRADIKAILWLESDDEEQVPEVKIGEYVRVYGTIRTQDGEKTLMVLKLTVTKDCNVVTAHSLEVLKTMVEAQIMSTDSAIKIKKNNPGASLANSMILMDENLAEKNQLNPMQVKCFNLLQADTSQAGMDRKTILSHFSAQQKNEANAVLEVLVTEGYAYTTIDSDHFKATDA
ncbi:unnamed protein product [Ceutorhynchus assimilis]|uniref:OB domain-containing protein n=1 Tax=Ceutorhynchus assimilis TaxID=467358 RepID=A0A9N9QK02_9CUCU|nr:unnamed protein product [Ceutorhynchus assimilis]